MIPRPADPIPQETHRFRVRAIFCFDGADQAPVRALVERMVEALGLELPLALLTSPEGFSAAIAQYRAELVVAFGPSAAAVVGEANHEFVFGQWSTRGMSSGDELPCLLTHDAKDVLAQPALKRPVWEHLKQVSQKLGLVPKTVR